MEERLRPVFTRVSPCEETQKRWLSQEIKFPVHAILPNEYLMVSAAANDGRMAVENKSGSQFAENINRMADDVIIRRGGSL